MNRFTARLAVVSLVIGVMSALGLSSADATTNASMQVVSVCVDEKPVADILITGDNEHPVTVTGDLQGTIPVNGTMSGTVSLEPGVEKIITVTIDRGDGPGKPFDLTQTVTGRTDCIPFVPSCENPDLEYPDCIPPPPPNPCDVKFTDDCKTPPPTHQQVCPRVTKIKDIAPGCGRVSKNPPHGHKVVRCDGTFFVTYRADGQHWVQISPVTNGVECEKQEGY